MDRSGLRVFDKLLAGEFASSLTYDFWPAEIVDSKKILIVLHGRGDRGEGYHWLPEALDMPELNYLFLDAPDSWDNGFSWYDKAPRQGPGIRRSRTLLMNLLASLIKECSLCPGDIYLFGFSQGCLMALDLALHYPKVFGGVVGLSGYIFFMEEYPKSLSPVALEQRIFLSHGTQDDVLSFSESKAHAQALINMGVHIDWREYEKNHTVNVSKEIPEIRAFLERLLNLS